MKVEIKEQPIHILSFGASNIGKGGRSAVAYNIANTGYQQNIITDFFCEGFTCPSNDKIEEIKKNGGNVYVDENPSRSYIKKQIRFLRRINETFKHSNYDIVHIHADNAEEIWRVIVGLKITRFFSDTVVISHAHTTHFMKETKWYRRIMSVVVRPYVLKNSIVCFACSISASNFMYGKKAGKTNKIVIAKNGIDTNHYKYNYNMRKGKRKELHLTDELVIGNVSGFYYPKNHIRIIGIFKEVIKKHPNAILLLVGDGILKESIEHIVIEMGLKDNVVFLGYRTDINQLLNAMDIYLMPSLFEGIALSGLEAQCSGLPCFFSSSIDSAISVSPNVSFISLDQTDEYWASRIMEVASHYMRKDESNTVRDAGYDIQDSYKEVIIKYKNISNSRHF